METSLKLLLPRVFTVLSGFFSYLNSQSLS